MIEPEVTLTLVSEGLPSEATNRMSDTSPNSDMAFGGQIAGQL